MTTKQMAGQLGGLTSGNAVEPKDQDKPKAEKKGKKVKKPATASGPAAVITAEDSAAEQAAPVVAPAEPAMPVEETIPPTVDHDPKKVGVHGAGLAVAAKEAAGIATPSLLDDILRADEDLQGSGVAAAITMANTILTDERTVGAFVNAVRTADQLGIRKLGFNRLEDQVRDEWEGLNFGQMEAQLKSWADKGDTGAGKILATFAAFKKSAVDVISPLWELMTVIVRPADSVNTYHDLSQLMKYLRDQRKLVQSRMADRNQKHWPQGTIVLGEGWHQVGYMPAMERNHKIPLAEAGWPYVLAAEGRAKEWAGQRKDQLEDLKSQADVISLEDVEGGKQGQVFLKTGPNSGALAAVKKDGRGLGVRIVRTIGMRARPGGWMRGDAPQADWPDSDLFFAFEAWKKKP